jgi:3-carboxy-cis,cis-muconate cycloisomerase
MRQTLTSSTLIGPGGERLRTAEVVGAVVRFEVALAAAQARLGLIPQEAASAIERAARDFSPDLDEIVAGGHAAGTPVIEILSQFGAHIEGRGREARQYLHRGATSQDALDTAVVLCVVPSVSAVLAAVERARGAAVSLARRHAASPMLGRTLMQPAGIITFGFKAALWAAALARSGRRLREAADRGLCLQLSGAVGTGAAFGEAWRPLQDAMATSLGLRAVVSWQSMRDEWLNLLLQLGLSVGMAAKIAGDITLMGQSEVGEAREPASVRGASTAMPHKRNPVLGLRIRGCWHVTTGTLAGLFSTMTIEHERGLGTWQAELALVPSLIDASVSAAENLATLLEGLEFDPERALRNIDATGGLVYADRAVQQMAEVLPRAEARRLVEQACAETDASGAHLRAALAEALARSGAPAAAARQDALLDTTFDVGAPAAAAAQAAERLLRSADRTAHEEPL